MKGLRQRNGFNFNKKKKKAVQKAGLAPHIPQERAIIKTTQNSHTPSKWTNISQKRDCSRSFCKNGGIIFWCREGTKNEEKIC